MKGDSEYPKKSGTESGTESVYNVDFIGIKDFFRGSGCYKH